MARGNGDCAQGRWHEAWRTARQDVSTLAPSAALSAVLVLALVLALAGCSMPFSASSSQPASQSASQSAAGSEQPVVRDVDYAPKTIDLVMVGDILAHSNVYESGLKSDGTYDFTALFAHVANEVSAADFAIVNQETILGGTELGLSNYPTFNSPTQIGDAEAAAGFDVVCSATNHCLDRGSTGIHNALQFWHTSHPAIEVLGIAETQADYDHIHVVSKGDFSIAVLNYTYGTNGIPVPADDPWAVTLLDTDKIVRDVELAKTQADMVVVCPHWGTEYNLGTDEDQRSWANLFLRLGVDVVIGSHPHVIEPVEVLTGDDGHQMLVFWSLGNFVSWQAESMTMVGGFARVRLVKEARGCHIESYELDPVVTQEAFGYGAITTYFLRDYTQALANENCVRTVMGATDFSLPYCQNLCSQVLGTGYDQATSSLKVTLAS